MGVQVRDGSCCCPQPPGGCECCAIEDMPDTVPVCIRYRYGGVSRALSGTVSRTFCGYSGQIGYSGNSLLPGYDELNLGSAFAIDLLCGLIGGDSSTWGLFLWLNPAVFPLASCTPNGPIIISYLYPSDTPPEVLFHSCSPFCVSLRWTDMDNPTPFSNPDCLWDVTITFGDCALPCVPEEGSDTGSETGSETGSDTGSETCPCPDSSVFCMADGVQLATLTFAGDCLWAGGEPFAVFDPAAGIVRRGSYSANYADYEGPTGCLGGTYVKGAFTGPGPHPDSLTITPGSCDV